METKNKNKKLSQKRRFFLKQASAVGVFGVFVGTALGITYRLGKQEEKLLRPPAAVDEKEFMALCIKCGQCLQVCPYDSIRLDSLRGGNLVGTPFIDAFRRGCYLCELLPCVLACPSGALDHSIDSVKDVRMGIAKVVKLDVCLALDKKPVTKEAIARLYAHSHTVSKEERKKLKLTPQSNPIEKRQLETKEIEKLHELEGKPCTICVDMCPYPNQSEAIELVDDGKGGKKPIIKQECVGCGVCVELCPTGVLAILPRETYKESA